MFDFILGLGFFAFAIYGLRTMLRFKAKMGLEPEKVEVEGTTKEYTSFTGQDTISESLINPASPYYTED